MVQSQTPESSDATPHRAVEEVERSWAPRPKRLLIGVVLIAIGIGGSILNGVTDSKQHNAPAAVVHGPVATQVKVLDGLRVRAELLSTTQAVGVVQIAVSFHNDTTHSQLIAPADVRLDVGRTSFSPIDTTSRSRGTIVRPGSYVTSVFRFAAHLLPSATLLYAPSWSHGRSLRWLLWS